MSITKSTLARHGKNPGAFKLGLLDREALQENGEPLSGYLSSRDFFGVELMGIENDENGNNRPILKSRMGRLAAMSTQDRRIGLRVEISQPNPNIPAATWK